MVTQKTVVKNYDEAMNAAAPQPVVAQQMENPPMQSTRTMPIIPIMIAALILGIGTGYLAFTKSGGMMGGVKQAATGGQTATTAETQKIEAGKVYGNPDSSTFKDSAEGVLLPGGVNGEGSFHIVRDGGESQNVYLTSSVVDLNIFVNHKVLVKGETFKARSAGWLMDVGQVKVLELNAQLPDWAKKAAQEAEMKGSGGQ